MEGEKMGKVTWHGWSTSYDQIPESSSIVFVKTTTTEQKIEEEKNLKKKTKNIKEKKIKK
jgi:hypothetical protein